MSDELGREPLIRRRDSKRVVDNTPWNSTECRVLLDVYIKGGGWQMASGLLPGRSPKSITTKIWKLVVDYDRADLVPEVNRAGTPWLAAEMDLIRLAKAYGETTPGRVAILLRRTEEEVRVKWTPKKREGFGV